MGSKELLIFKTSFYIEHVFSFCLKQCLRLPWSPSPFWTCHIDVCWKAGPQFRTWQQHAGTALQTTVPTLRPYWQGQLPHTVLGNVWYSFKVTHFLTNFNEVYFFCQCQNVCDQNQTFFGGEKTSNILLIDFPSCHNCTTVLCWTISTSMCSHLSAVCGFAVCPQWIRRRLWPSFYGKRFVSTLFTQIHPQFSHIFQIHKYICNFHIFHIHKYVCVWFSHCVCIYHYTSFVNIQFCVWIAKCVCRFHRPFVLKCKIRS